MKASGLAGTDFLGWVTRRSGLRAKKDRRRRVSLRFWYDDLFYLFFVLMAFANVTRVSYKTRVDLSIKKMIFLTILVATKLSLPIPHPYRYFQRLDILRNPRSSVSIASVLPGRLFSQQILIIIAFCAGVRTASASLRMRSLSSMTRMESV